MILVYKNKIKPKKYLKKAEFIKNKNSAFILGFKDLTYP